MRLSLRRRAHHGRWIGLAFWQVATADVDSKQVAQGSPAITGHLSRHGVGILGRGRYGRGQTEAIQRMHQTERVGERGKVWGRDKLFQTRLLARSVAEGLLIGIG